MFPEIHRFVHFVQGMYLIIIIICKTIILSEERKQIYLKEKAQKDKEEAEKAEKSQKNPYSVFSKMMKRMKW